MNWDLVKTIKLAGLGLFLWGIPGFAQDASRGGRVETALTADGVIALATARIKANGFEVPEGAEWSMAVQVRDSGLVWSVQASSKGRFDPYWLHVDDASGAAEFVMPILKLDTQDEAGKDWLIQTYLAITEIDYPVRFETFIDRAFLTGAQPHGGGTSKAGEFFFDYTLRGKPDSPEGFEVRCFYEVPNGSKGSKFVTRAVVNFVDAALYRYRLVLE